MTAATAAVKGKISNLTVLEGAFSHNALGIDPDGPINGAFKSVIDNAKVAGRIATAHSDHDGAVWIACPLASRVFRDSYSLRLALAGPLGLVFGGPTDRYGAIGANGPQNLVDIDVNRFSFTGTALPELKSGVNVPDCTSFVASHSDVKGRPISSPPAFYLTRRCGLRVVRCQPCRFTFGYWQFRPPNLAKIFSAHRRGGKIGLRCPLRVRRRHRGTSSLCPLYP
jgi:hypothetical protein